MKKYLTLVFLTLLFISLLSFPFLSYAQSYEPKPTPKANWRSINFVDVKEAKKAEIKEKIELKKAEQETKREAIQIRREERVASKEAKLNEARLERIRTYYGRVYTRFQAAISRLQILIQRIEARVSYINENNENIDTSAIEADLTEAKALLLEAEMELEATSESFNEVLNSEDPKPSFQIIKDEVITIKDKLKQVHRILVHVIGDIKGLRVGNTPRTTTETEGDEVDATSEPEPSPEVSPLPTEGPVVTPTPTAEPTISPIESPDAGI